MHKLYLRIWLAVVLAVAVLTLMVGWAWRMAADPPLREVVVRNQAGEVIGSGKARHRHPPGAPFGPPPMRHAEPPQPLPGEAPPDDAPSPGSVRPGPEFEVRMQDGQTLHMHLPRPPQSSWRAPFGFFWTLGLVAVAVALATYPIIRRLTRRLEELQHSVEQWGEGQLSIRAPEGGKDEIGFLASRFNRAAQQIETLVQARDALLASQKSLLANASHELRSPLARIRMGLELIGDGGAPATDKTDVWVFFDRDNLYVSARMYESEPGKRVARVSSSPAICARDRYISRPSITTSTGVPAGTSTPCSQPVSSTEPTT